MRHILHKKILILMITLVSGPAFSSESEDNNIKKPNQEESSSEGGACFSKLPQSLVGSIYRLHREESFRAVNHASRNGADEGERIRINELDPDALIHELRASLSRANLKRVRVYAIISRFNNDDDTLINTHLLNRVYDGRTALMLAVMNGHTEVVRALLDAGANINIVDTRSCDTVLMVAAHHGHTEIVRALLARDGININQANETGYTALMMAARGGHTEVVRDLLDASADINLLDNNGRTPLIWAASRGHADVVRALLARDGININHVDGTGYTALMMAARGGHTEVVRDLLDAGADINRPDNNGRTPLILAAGWDSTEVVRALLARDGININHAAGTGYTALNWAAQEGHTEIVRALLARDGININRPDNNGLTALMWAAEEGHTDIVVLIENHTTKKIPLDGDSATKIPKHRKDDHNGDDSTGKTGDKAVRETSSGVKRKLSGVVSTSTSTKKARGNPKKDDTRLERVIDDRDFHSSYEHFTNKLAPLFSTAAFSVMIGLPRGKIVK